MKTPIDRCKRGFTLVELLVVIAIIAVLASASFIVANQAIQKSHHMACLAAATAIEKAVTDFATEYGSTPTSGDTDETFETDKASGVNLMTVLMGKETVDPPLNVKRLNLLSVKEGKKVGTAGTKGMIYNTDDSILGLYDAWGNGYFVMIDSDGDDNETINPPIVGKDSTTRGVLHRRVAVWSAGADKIVGGTRKGDDFKSW